MSLPQTCPFCGAGIAITADGMARMSQRRVEFGCGTNIGRVADARRFQSVECEVRERTRLAARVAELEARCKRLEEAGNHMLEAIYTPEPPRCVCDRSFPCDDCVNYSSARDAKQKWQQAKEAKP